MKFNAIVVLAVFSVSIVKAQQGNANNYIDRVLDEFRKNSDVRRQLDPLRINEKVDIDGKGEATDIVINGLMSLGRKGDATLTAVDGNNINLEASLGINGAELSARYRYKVKWFIKFKGSVRARVDSIACKIAIAVDNGVATLKHFQVTDFSKIHVTHFTGASVVFNWLGKLIVEKVVNSQRNRIRSELEKVARAEIANALKKVNINDLINNF